MYSDAIRQMMEFVLHLVSNDVTPFTIKHSSMKINWSFDELILSTSDSRVKIQFGLLKTDEETNYISLHCNRFNIRYNNLDFKSFLVPGTTVLTSELLHDEGTYFQHNILCELPDYDDIKDLTQVATELVQNKLQYIGSYKIPLFDMKKVVKKIEECHPETIGCWEKYK